METKKFHKFNWDKEMKKIRPIEPKDQEKTNDFYQDLCELLIYHGTNQPMQGHIQAGALWSCFCDIYIASEFTYEEFCEEVHDALKHAKLWFDK